MPSFQRLGTALRALLLPITEGNYQIAVERARTALLANGIDEDDHAEAVGAYYGVWSDTGTAPGALVDLVREALSAEPLLSERFSRDYFRTHEALMNSVLSFDAARGLLSSAVLVAHLLKQSFSCAQIANAISGSQAAVEYSWQQVQKVVRTLGPVPSLEQFKAESVTQADREQESVRFADASPLEGIELIAVKAMELGFRADIRPDLTQFYSEFVPQYSVILHANALTVEFFDHPPQQAAYEFQPRGGVIAWLQSIHSSYSATESAYLNNSKGAYAFDANWAWGRQPSFWASAHALSNILAGLGQMPYSGRRELCGWLRQWLLRIERVYDDAAIEVTPAVLSEAESFIAGAFAGNTATSGVLDQRVLDFMIPPRFESGAGWVSRGVGDHVNATNTSRSKFGDLEFENSTERRVEAFEAHGGKLTDIYVEGHRASLRRVLRQRAPELIAIAPASDWRIRVTFVAHDVQVTPVPVEYLAGFSVEWEFLTYESFLDQALSLVRSPSGLEMFNAAVVQRVSHVYVPDRVKLQYLHLARAQA